MKILKDLDKFILKHRKIIEFIDIVIIIIATIYFLYGIFKINIPIPKALNILIIPFTTLFFIFLIISRRLRGIKNKIKMDEEQKIDENEAIKTAEKHLNLKINVNSINLEVINNCPVFIIKYTSNISAMEKEIYVKAFSDKIFPHKNDIKTD